MTIFFVYQVPYHGFNSPTDILCLVSAQDDTYLQHMYNRRHYMLATDALSDQVSLWY